MLTSADDDDVGAFDFDAASNQKLDDAVRRAGQERLLARHHFADVYRMKAVHVLGGVDCEKHFGSR